MRDSKPHHPRQHHIQQHSMSQSVHIGLHSQAKPNQNETFFFFWWFFLGQAFLTEVVNLYPPPHPGGIPTDTSTQTPMHQTGRQNRTENKYTMAREKKRRLKPICVDPWGPDTNILDLWHRMGILKIRLAINKDKLINKNRESKKAGSWYELWTVPRFCRILPPIHVLPASSLSCLEHPLSLCAT